MLDSVKRAVDRAIRFVRTEEPLVVLNTVAGVVAVVAQLWSSELTAEDGWPAAVWALLVVVSRHFVTPAASSTTGDDDV